MKDRLERVYGMAHEHFEKPNRPCPICGGRDRFTYFSKEPGGRWYCRACGWGDGIDLVMRATNRTFPETLESLLPRGLRNHRRTFGQLGHTALEREAVVGNVALPTYAAARAQGADDTADERIHGHIAEAVTLTVGGHGQHDVAAERLVGVAGQRLVV